jgi:hypothetical protein
MFRPIDTFGCNGRDGHVDDKAHKNGNHWLPRAVLDRGCNMVTMDWPRLSSGCMQVEVVWHDDGAQDSSETKQIGTARVCDPVDSTLHQFFAMHSDETHFHQEASGHESHKEANDNLQGLDPQP